MWVVCKKVYAIGTHEEHMSFSIGWTIGLVTSMQGHTSKNCPDTLACNIYVRLVSILAIIVGFEVMDANMSRRTLFME